MSCTPVSNRISTRASDSCGSACLMVTVSSSSECETVRDFAPYQRCRVTYSINDCSSISLHLLFLPELEPEESPRRERQEVGELPDRREGRTTQHFDGNHPGMVREVELHGLRRAGEVVHAENYVVLPGADVGEDPRVVAG